MNEFSRAFLEAYERMPQWRRDQVDTSMRELVAALERVADLVQEWQAQGIAAAEEHANTEEPV